MPEVLNNMKNTGVVDNGQSGERQLVVFRLAEEEFGVEIEIVKEIVRLPDITPIPRSPDYVAGICNLRGNVLPVIDTRARFSMKNIDASDHTRLLVVDVGGLQTGIIVDSMREVMRLNDSYEEPPPSVCRGIDREYLSGVVKVDDGERLILKLNLKEVLAIDIDAEDLSDEDIQKSVSELQNSRENETELEEQLVSFKVAGDEYAFDIKKVREIIKITEITNVPNVPDYVKGLFTIRSNLLPIIDLRQLLGFPSLISEYHAKIDKAVKRQRQWAENLRRSLESRSHFTGVLNAKDSDFGIWLESYSTASLEVEAAIKRLKKMRANLYNSGTRALEMSTESRGDALALFNDNTLPLLEFVVENMGKFKETLEDNILEDRRALVVESESVTIGYLVDWVDEVLRIPKSVIDETPAMAASEQNELKAVAKLNKGERLIMIMDESALVSHETSRVLSDIKRKKEQAGKSKRDLEEKSLAQQVQDEVQLVTFTINRQEYGIGIMQVQEINRVTEITSVPRAPYFIDGMTNLRGDVVPVLNIRKLFGLEDIEADEKARIIIVDIGGNKTGMRVDQVNEVLRLAKRDIEKTPGIILSEGANNYMEGVCKIDHGARMVVLLNVGKILDEEELKSLDEIAKDPRAKTKPSAAMDKKVVPSEKKKAEKSGKKKKLEIAE